MAQAFDRNRMADNVAEIHRCMAEAAKAAGRRPEEVLLCAACKTRTPEIVRESALLPVDLFGENRVQEMLANLDAGAYQGKPCHFIGHLQTNKVKKVVGRAAVIQSVDSLRLLEAIQTEAAGQGLIQDILFEINIAGELSKDGAAKNDLWLMLDAAAAMHNVRLRGLMAIPPAYDNGQESRQYFAMLRQMLEQVGERHYENMALDTLSMGMTDSFEAAILEGATIVRVGTGIYGARE
jgi:pyridoxal phosphate enzyme (YggS family)